MSALFYSIYLCMTTYTMNVLCFSFPYVQRITTQNVTPAVQRVPICVCVVIQGRSVYYHHVVVEDLNLPKQLILVKCVTTQHREKRNVLPAGFQEPE